MRLDLLHGTTPRLLLLPLLPTLVAFVACGDDDSSDGDEPGARTNASGPNGPAPSPGEGGSAGGGGDASGGDDGALPDGSVTGGATGAPPGSPGTSGGWPAGTSGTGGPGTTGAEAPDGGGAGKGGGPGGGESGGSQGGGDPGRLTAGEWRDLDHWDFWRALFKNGEPWAGMESHWSLFTQARFSVVVANDGVAVTDAEVVLLDGDDPVWTARTDNHGRAELFAGLFGGAVADAYTVRARSASSQAEATDVAPTSGGDPIPLELEAPEPRAGLDLMFVVDTTGSMGDELSYLQTELADVIQRVDAAAGQDLEVRLSVNFYRDEGDDYVVRAFPFTADRSVALGQLSGQAANGGGDTPEAVEVAFYDAVFEHAWSASARARLMFFVLDAPPHYEPQRVAKIQESIREAARLGIRVIPVASSGIDKDTEFLLRLTAVATAGTYTFLTDHSGIGGPHVEPTIGEYQVERLNDLLVRIISAAVKH